MDSFICKLSIGSNTNIQVFYILISTFEIARLTRLMFNYFRFILTLLHANAKASLIIFLKKNLKASKYLY